MKNLMKTMMALGIFFVPLSLFSQDSDGIEEVIVSATKTESNVQDLPMVVDVLTATQIEDMNITTARDIDSALPTLIVNYNVDPFNASMRIRGIGTSQSDASLESDVSLVVDGVYLNKTGLGLNDLIDVERIEVLQGPQGTLYGKNSNAGVVNITTKTPRPGDSDGFIHYESGDFNSTRMTSALSFGVSDSTAIRLSANITESDGYMTNLVDGSSANGVDDSVIGIKIAHENDNLRFVFSHSDISKDSTCCAVDSVPTSQQVQLGIPLLGRTPSDNDYTNYKYATKSGTPQFTLDSTLTSFKVDQERENGTLTYILARNKYDAMRYWDADFTSIEFANLKRTMPGKSLTNELRFTSNMMGNKEYTVGVFFMNSEYGEAGGYPNKGAILFGDDFPIVWGTWAQQLTTAATGLGQLAALGAANAAQLAQLAALQEILPTVGGIAATTNAGDYIAQDMMWSDSTAAIFGRMTVHVSDTFRYTVGARYTSEDKEADLFAKAYLGGSVTPGLAATLGMPSLAGAPRQAVLGDAWPYSAFLQNIDSTFTRSDSASTWSFSMQKDLSDDVMLYASAATGYKAGGFNSTSGDTGDMREFDKTESTNYEIGIKSRLMDNKVQVNATAFSMETDGQHYITQSPSGTGTVVGNATTTAERLGFDLNVIAKLTSNLTLNMSYFTVDDGSPDILSNAAARLTPDDAYTVGLSHNFPLGNGNVFSRVDYSYDGPYEYSSAPMLSPSWQAQMTTAYPELDEKTDQEFLNYKVGWRNDSWELAYSVKNATDNNYVRLVLIASGLSGVNGMTMGAPETHSFSVKYNF
jgi:iron complex outermembrane receptor protein